MANQYDFWLVQGRYGTGKTLFLTALSKMLNHNYKKVYANYNLNKDFVPNFEHIDEFSIDVISTFEKPSMVLITEAYKYIDKRECMKKKNVLISQGIQEIRKDEYFLVCDVMDSAMVDFRFLNVSTAIINALGNKGNLNEKYKNIFEYQYGIYDVIKGEFNFNPNSFYMDMKDVYNIYDTREKINKPENKKEKE